MNESVDHPKAVAVVLATRVSAGSPKRLECLCLAPGQRRQYRLYSTANVDLVEDYGPEDLDPVEFDIASDIAVSTFLIESFWRVHVSPLELERQLHRIEPLVRSSAH